MELPKIKPIPVDVKEGDVVIIARKQPNCECADSLWMVGTLTKIVEPAAHGWPYVLPCMHCGQTSVSHWWGFIGGDMAVRIDQLKKLQPPSADDACEHADNLPDCTPLPSEAEPG